MSKLRHYVINKLLSPLVYRDGEGDLAPGAGHVPPLSHHHRAEKVPGGAAGHQHTRGQCPAHHQPGGGGGAQGGAGGGGHQGGQQAGGGQAEAGGAHGKCRR